MALCGPTALARKRFGSTRIPWLTSQLRWAEMSHKRKGCRSGQPTPSPETTNTANKDTVLCRRCRRHIWAPAAVIRAMMTRSKSIPFAKSPGNRQRNLLLASTVGWANRRSCAGAVIRYRPRDRSESGSRRPAAARTPRRRIRVDTSGDARMSRRSTRRVCVLAARRARSGSAAVGARSIGRWCGGRGRTASLPMQVPTCVVSNGY
jgi:hypothetical protein